ncbi:flavin-containing monooxygenase FMO GS-OX-like 8 isoform X2 [Eurytemora carolleeae]|nr:flavin-containing monooxygenase FMO GS-OX-like 8 isoform X2 [Eurytemora carolleeae]|eukprot:XP_023330766.1 flavin-containing monooxygenase FMO GS-OX-like 8 isoform X2 [Eurytemora affinis]
MYRYLWSNGPKETLEFPQYTFEEHFGKAIPSFPPREVLFDYLQGRWKKEDIKKYVKFNTVVRDVCYNKETDDFTVSVKRLDEDQVEDGERFDYVVVASGHYSVPNVPSFPGIDRFPGRVLHSHDFREANEFTGKRLLCIGASYSAEDIALQCIKYGAESVVISYRTKAMGFNWPKEITERPLVDRFEGKTVHFKDGSSSEVDAVIMCTGYLHSYPYLREELRLKASNVLYPPGLYKGLVWQKGGNNKLLYSGVQDQYYTYTMFDVCGLWIAKLIQGKVQLPDRDTMEKDWKTWHARCGTLNSDAEDISFQTDFIQDLVKDLGDDYPYNVDTQEIFNTWEHHKVEDILSYRDKSFASKYTGTPSPIHHTTFMKALDDSMATFLDQRKN